MEWHDQPEDRSPSFQDWSFGKQILNKQRKCEQSKHKDKHRKKEKLLKKKDKRTVITFKYKGAFISAQDMIDAGFECEKTIAVYAFDKNKKKLLTERLDGSPYWSSLNSLCARKSIYVHLRFHSLEFDLEKCVVRTGSSNA